MEEQIIALLRNAWKTQTNAVSEYFKKNADDFYDKEIAPGRNKATYILGHLIATNDGLLPLLGFGDKLYPDLDRFFIPNTPWHYDDFPPVAELKARWDNLNHYLEEKFDTLTPGQWLDRHTKVSPEDFALDPKRNKLNLLTGRTNHTGYHLGQLNLLKN
ncbi:MAG: DinB family protein [Puia sp.]|nr:DinB family protein [Puia sp.]